jgi:multiple sugar transport system permease protein
MSEPASKRHPVPYSRRDKWLTDIALALVTIVFASPFIWIAAAAFDQSPGDYLPWPNEPSLDNFRYLFNERNTGRALRNSLVVAGSTMVLSTFLSSLAGFGLSRLRFRRKNVVVYAILLLYALPLAATMVAVYDLADRMNLTDTYRGLVLAQSAIALPFLTWLMKGFYDSIPISLDEAAWMDGRSTLRGWWDVLLPLSKTGLAITAGFAFVAAWSEVLLVTILIYRADLATLPLQFFYDAEGRTDAQITAALGVLYLAPVLLLFLLLRRWMVRSLLTSTRGL